jgi:hypothetical protein
MTNICGICGRDIPEDCPYCAHVDPIVTPRTRLFELHQLLCLNALELMKKKNVDYGGDTDPFRNFHTFGELGILVRLSDKLARLRTYCERGELKIKDESVEDTIIDAINYLVLLMGYIKREEIYGKDVRDPS